MVAQHEVVGVAQVGLQAGLFFGAKGHALVAVVGQGAEYEGALLADGQHARRLRAHRHARARMGVQHATCVFAGLVHGAVDDEACRVDRVGRVDDFVAVFVYLHQAGGGDLVKHQAVGVDQKMMLWPGQLGADVGKHQVAPAVHSHQAVARGQVAADSPLFGADLGLDGGHGHGGSFRLWMAFGPILVRWGGFGCRPVSPIGLRAGIARWHCAHRKVRIKRSDAK